MLTIRLQRVGKAKHPTYRLIISEKARDTQYNYLELLGTFDPHAKEDKQMIFKTDRIKYWLEKGSQTSNTVHNLFMKHGIIGESKKKKSVYISKKRTAKLAEKKKSAKVETPVAEVKTEEKTA